MVVSYKQPTNDKDNKVGYDNCGYASAVAPVIPVALILMMSGNQMYGSIPDDYDNIPNDYDNIPNGYGSEPTAYTSGPFTTEIQNLESNVHKTKAHLSKHKHKNHSKHHITKHHKTGKIT